MARKKNEASNTDVKNTIKENTIMSSENKTEKHPDKEMEEFLRVMSARKK